jgi:coenzyme F420-reducing hydrogenase beta subunit
VTDKIPQVTPANKDGLFTSAGGEDRNAPYSHYLGTYSEVYAGFATDPNNRQRVASGGLVTTLLAHALREDMIDGVAVVKSDFSEQKIGYKFDILTDPDQVQSYGTSAYFNIPVEKHWKQLDEFDGRIGMCALPCHTSILRNRRTTGRGLANVELFISLFCGHNNEIELLRFIFEKEGVKESEVTDMRVNRSYLGGDVMVTLQDGAQVPIPFRHFNVYRSLGFFSKAMCRYCDDHLGGQADLSIGDIFLKEYRGQDVKHSAVIVRNDIGKKLMHSAIEQKIVDVEQISGEKVFRAQKRILTPSADTLSRYHACRMAGFTAKRPQSGSFRLRSFCTYFMLNLNDHISRTQWGPKVLKWIPRPLLYAYIGSLKIINNTLRPKK